MLAVVDGWQCPHAYDKHASMQHALALINLTKLTPHTMKTLKWRSETLTNSSQVEYGLAFFSRFFSLPDFKFGAPRRHLACFFVHNSFSLDFMHSNSSQASH